MGHSIPPPPPMPKGWLHNMILRKAPDYIRREVHDLEEIISNLTNGVIKRYDDIHQDNYKGWPEATWFLNKARELVEGKSKKRIPKK